MTFHIKPNQINEYNPHLGDARFDTTSIQYNPDRANEYTETMRQRTANNGRPLVIDLDENNPAGSGLTDKNAADLRKRVLYDVYFSGGSIEWYFGYHNLPLGGDMRTEDFRTREDMYRYMWYARDFMQKNLPFWEMQPNDGLLSGESGAFGGGQVFFKAGEVYAVYLPDASPSGTLSLAPGNYTKRWYNPRTGQFVGAATNVSGGSVALGNPPNSSNEDWVVLFTGDGGTGGDNIPPTASFTAPFDGQNLSVGDNLTVDVDANDADGSVSNVRLFLNDVFVRQENITPYLWGDRDQDAALKNLAEGTYTLKAVVTDNDNATTEESIQFTVGTVAEPKTLNFNATDDAYLQSGNRQNINILRVESGRRVASDPGNGVINVYRGVGNNWNENNLNASNAPTKGALLGSLSGAWNDGSQYSFELDSSVATNGAVSLILEMESGGNDTAFSSSEGSVSPELEVTFTP